MALEPKDQGLVAIGASIGAMKSASIIEAAADNTATV